MTEFTFEAQTKTNKEPPFMVIYGPAGVGKTTFANASPNNVFLQTEEGTGELELQTIKADVFKSYDEFIAALRWIYKNGEYKTLVIDSLDHLEPLLWAKVCDEEGQKSIEKVGGGYGKGYIEVDKYWRSLIDILNMLRRDKDMAIIVLAHDHIRPANDPLVEAYDVHELKLHKRAVALWKESCDLIGLLRMVVVKDSNSGKGKGGTTPSLYVRPQAGIVAKTRFSKMPQIIPISLDKGWDDVAQYIPYYANDYNNNVETIEGKEENG